MFFVVSTSTSMIIFSAIRLQKALNTDNDNKLLLKFVKNLKNMDKNHKYLIIHNILSKFAACVILWYCYLKLNLLENSNCL